MQNPNIRNLLADVYRLVERYEALPPDPARDGDSSQVTYFLEMSNQMMDFLHRWEQDPDAYPLALKMAIVLYEWKEQQAKALTAAKRETNLDRQAAERDRLSAAV